MTGRKIRIPIEQITEAVRGKNVGVLTNGVVWLEEAGDDLAGVVRRTCEREVLLYAEHGYRGDGGPGDDTATGGMHAAYSDRESRCLYARNLRGQKELIDDLDLVVLGLPGDVGVRHDSFKRATCHLMELAAECGKPAVLVDFPNPVRGDIVEGNLPDPAFAERAMREWQMPWPWHAAPITYRHGMTNGELALLAKAHLGLDLDLRIIAMEGWRRDVWGDETGLPVVPQDPSIYNLDVNLGHLCTGLFQGTTLSWGIGTAEPFLCLGAPWIEDDRILHAIRELELPGVTWSRAFFLPRWNEPGDQGILWRRFAYEPCNGIRLHFTDRDAVRVARVQLSLLVEFLRHYPGQFELVTENRRFDVRLEDDQWRRRLEAGEGVETILAEWSEMSRRFEATRKEFLLY